MFTKMQESAAKSNEKLAFLSTHPLTRKRIEAAEKRAESYENGTWKAPK
jgi:predicted Zn-dependent protease